MRITTKLAIGLAATSAVVLGAYGVRRVIREETAARTRAERDLKLLLVAVQVSVEQAKRNGQAADVSKVIESISHDDPEVEVFVFDTAGRLDSTTWGTVKTLPYATSVVADALRTRAPVIRDEGGAAPLPERGGPAHQQRRPRAGGSGHRPAARRAARRDRRQDPVDHAQHRDGVSGARGGRLAA